METILEDCLKLLGKYKEKFDQGKIHFTNAEGEINNKDALYMAMKTCELIGAIKIHALEVKK